MRKKKEKGEKYKRKHRIMGRKIKKIDRLC
jgi:hypothetical protein